ncbi:MAG: ATP synthase F1 subunit epsilon [Pseudomonadota bacterium]
MKFQLVSPERSLASVDADTVTVPGQVGDLTAMPGHAPFLTTLRPGRVVVQSGGVETVYVVTGGFAEISPDAVSVLAEEAVEAAALDRAWVEERIKQTEAALADAGTERAQIEAQKLSDFRFLAEQTA